MGIDWREQTWWSYQAALWNWNEVHGGGTSEPDIPNLKRLIGGE